MISTQNEEGGPVSESMPLSAKARQLADAREAKERAREIFPRFGAVNGVGLTRVADGYAVRVSFEIEPRNRAQMPKEIEGIPVIVRVVGPVQKQTS